MAKKIVRENPALLVGEERADLEKGETICSETLIAYPNEIEFEIVEE